MASVRQIGNRAVLCLEAGDPMLASEHDANDLVGLAFAEGAMIIAVPVEQLPADFFRLRSGLAGLFAQKMVNYHLTLAAIGDIADHLAASAALRDWVRETNRGDRVWFLPSGDALVAHLARAVRS